MLRWREVLGRGKRASKRKRRKKRDGRFSSMMASATFFLFFLSFLLNNTTNFVYLGLRQTLQRRREVVRSGGRGRKSQKGRRGLGRSRRREGGERASEGDSGGRRRRREHALRDGGRGAALGGGQGEAQHLGLFSLVGAARKKGQARESVQPGKGRTTLSSPLCQFLEFLCALAKTSIEFFFALTFLSRSQSTIIGVAGSSLLQLSSTQSTQAKERHSLTTTMPAPSPNSISIVPQEVADLGPKAFGASHLFAGDLRDPTLQLGPHGGATAPFSSPVDGIRLASYWLPAKDPVEAKGIIVFVHGHGSYFLHEVGAISGAGQPPRYAGSWAEKLNEAGYSVCGIDNRGMGFSGGARGGLRCFTESFDDYVTDVAAFASATVSSPSNSNSSGFSIPVPKGFGPGLPLFLFGVSLGGCISVHVAENLQKSEKKCDEKNENLKKHFKGCVLLAPMLAIDALASRGINRLLVHVGKLISIIRPTLGIAHGTKNELYPDLQAIWDADPLCWHGATRARSAMEYLRVTRALSADGNARLRSFKAPFMVLHGDGDTLTDPKGSKDLHEASESEDKILRILEGRWHILTKEPGNEEVLAEIVEWCDKRGGRVEL